MVIMLILLGVAILLDLAVRMAEIKHMEKEEEE